MWVDDQDEDTVPLLEGEPGQAVDQNLSIAWPGPWDTGEKNQFLSEEWKPLTDQLSEGERRWDNFVDTSYVLNTPVKTSPLFLVQNSPDIFEKRKEPEIEPS